MRKRSGDTSGAGYRGEDRRRVAGPVKSPFGRLYWLALGMIALLAVQAIFFTHLASSAVAPVGMLVPLLQVASFTVALALSAMAFSRWYLTGDAPALWVGVALTIYGAFRLAVAELLPIVLVDVEIAQWAVWLRPASQLVIIGLLVRAITMVQVAPTSGPKLAAGVLVALAGVAALMAVYPPLATVMDGAQGPLPRSYSAVNQVGVIPFAFTLLGAAYTWRGLRLRRWLFAWLGLLFLSIALGDLARVYAPPPVIAGLFGKELLRLLGLLIALVGATREILYTYRDSSTRLARSEFTAMTAQERIREGQAAAEERAHEARSALAAIEGATRTLEHYRDRLPPETQEALSTAVSGEIRRLQRLVSVGEPLGEFTSFSVAEALGPVVATERARGATIDVAVAPDLNVVGRTGSTEQVIQTLFDNARRYAPGSTISVRAERVGIRVVMRVEDRGPGVPRDQHEAIFRRGVRGDAAMDVPGSGLGLYVAADLMREQGGELWVEDRPGGGASFALSLPAVGGSTEEGPDGAQEGTEVPDDSGMSTADGRH
jgi:signal transduction histidine kinase